MRWSHVHLFGLPYADPPVPPYIEVWRSVRAGGDTKTRKTRRTLALPARCVDALKAQRYIQAAERAMTPGWHDDDLVFASRVGTEMDAHNVQREFRAVLKATSLDAKQWTPRELRHSFVSLLGDDGVPIEEISRLVGHSSIHVTETVYRHELRPVVQRGAVVMDKLFAAAR